MTTIKEEILNMIGMNCNFEFKVDSLDFLIDDVYQWHIQQQIKLLEEVKKAIMERRKHINIFSKDTGDMFTSDIDKQLNSKITNLKGEL